LIWREGEIHALRAKTARGKSTLMNILYGLYQPDEGEIRINDKLTRITSPHDAIAPGHRDGSPSNFMLVRAHVTAKHHAGTRVR